MDGIHIDGSIPQGVASFLTGRQIMDMSWVLGPVPEVEIDSSDKADFSSFNCFSWQTGNKLMMNANYHWKS